MSKIVLIEGAGRSGSTLLHSLLGGITGLTGLGEVAQAWDSGFLLNERCGCGELFSICSFWSDVRERVEEKIVLDTKTLQMIVDDRKRIVRLPVSTINRMTDEELQASPFANAHRALYEVARDVAGPGGIVDSSKKPSYTALVRRLFPGESRSIHIVRHPAAVAFSLQRRKVRPDSAELEEMPRYPAWRAGLAWVRRNLKTELTLRGAESVRVRYEDLIRDPSAVLAPVIDGLGLPGGGVGHLASDGLVQLPRTHSVAGNPRKFEAGRQRLVLDDEWRTSLSAWDRGVVAVSTGLVARRYGYRIGRRSPY